MEEKKDLEVKQESTVALRRSGGDHQPAGFDGVEEGDIKMPRLSILQGLSEICIEGKGKMGDLANSLTKEIYGANLEFIPLFMFKTRAQFETGKGLVMYSRDNIKVTMALEGFAEHLDKPVEEVPGAEWDGDQPPTFGVVYNFPIMLVGNLFQFPISLSLMKTATKAAKELVSMARYSGEDMFARVYSIKSKIEKSDQGTYAVPVIEFKRRCNDAEYATAKIVFDKLYRLKTKIDVELEAEATEEK